MPINRRLFSLGVGSCVLGTAPASATGNDERSDLLLILIADLHSGYAYTAALVKTVRDLIASDSSAEKFIFVNGDIFERGNALCRKNNGRIDLETLKVLASLAPTFVNMGNHDGDIIDPREFVAEMTRVGATPLTNILDPRTRQPYGEANTAIVVRDKVLRVSALGTPALETYRNGLAWYSVPQPGPYAASHFPETASRADLHVALVHAGFRGDLSVLPSMNEPFVLHGGHDHLQFIQKVGPHGLHIHSGHWSNGLAVVRVSFHPSAVGVEARQIQLNRTSPEDAGMASLIAKERKAILDDMDLQVLGRLPAELTLDEAALFAAEAVRKAAGAEIGFLNHTTFGDGLPAGPITAFDLASLVRFDNAISCGSIDGTLLADKILPITNQFGDFAYGSRTGDFLYSTIRDVDRNRTYKIAVNNFAVRNSGNIFSFFGAADLVFQPIAGLQLKSAIIEALIR